MVLEAVDVPLENQRLLNVAPPPEKVIAVLLVSVILMVELEGVRVRPVVVAVVQTVPVAAKLQVPVPISIDLVLEFEELTAPASKDWLLASKVPLVIVRVLAASILK
jgi:hypothetical protein